LSDKSREERRKTEGEQEKERRTVKGRGKGGWSCRITKKGPRDLAEGKSLPR
jgi:hypothetical protein